MPSFIGTEFFPLYSSSFEPILELTCVKKQIIANLSTLTVFQAGKHAEPAGFTAGERLAILSNPT
jgi:hypothetical protein